MAMMGGDLPPSTQEVVGYGGYPDYGPLFFPFPPNWKSPFDETLTCRSWAIVAEDGSEQTGSNDGNRPRLDFEFVVSLNHRHTQMLENMVFAYQSRSWLMAHWAEGAKLQSSVAAGTQTLLVDTRFLSFDACKYAVIYSDPDTWEIVFVDTVYEGSLSIVNGGTQYDWPAGTKVYPVYEGFLNASLQGRRKSDTFVEMPVRFTCEPSAVLDTTASIEPPAAMYRGVELYRGRLNWNSDVETTFDSDYRLIDLNTGKLKTHSASRWTAQVRKHQVLLKDRESTYDFRQWLLRREGVARPCWMESGMTDFTLAEPLVSSAEYIKIEKNRYGELAAAHPARRDILIQFRDGTYAVRRVVSVSQYSPTVEQLALDAPLPAGLTAANFKRISYLNAYRLTTQAVTLRHVTDGVATAEVNLKPRRTPLDMASASLAMPAATQGHTFSYQYFASGGLRPYTWATLSTLPTGLALSESGHLTGIPSAPGTYTIDVRATDVEGQTLDISRTLTVAAAPEIEITTGYYTMSSVYSGLAVSTDGSQLRDTNTPDANGWVTGVLTSTYDQSPTQFIHVDLGAQYVLKRVTVGGGALPSYQAFASENLNGRLLQWSNDDSNWTTILTFSGITDTGQLDKDFTFPETQARYWRIAGASPGQVVGTSTLRFFGFAVG